jgi:hypothetical protein
LGNQHPIKRIFVVEWQVLDAAAVGRSHPLALDLHPVEMVGNNAIPILRQHEFAISAFPPVGTAVLSGPRECGDIESLIAW